MSITNAPAEKAEPATKPAQLTDATKPTQRTKIWYNVAVRLADEGVPVRAIVRSLMLPYEDVREALDAACERGMILTIPRDDWPPGTRRDERQPDTVPLEIEDDHVTMLAMRTFNLTPSMARIFVALLRRSEMTKQALHVCIQKEDGFGIHRDFTDIRIIDVHVCKMRTRLPKAIRIITLRGVGYYIPTTDKAEAYRLLGVKHDEFAPPTDGGSRELKPDAADTDHKHQPEG